jgi:hypothetical protein
MDIAAAAPGLSGLTSLQVLRRRTVRPSAKQVQPMTIQSAQAVRQLTLLARALRLWAL